LLYGQQILANSARPDPLVITSTTLPNGQYGSPYSPPAIAVTGGSAPYTFVVNSGLPPGVSLAADGSLSGTPTAAGSYTINVTVTDATPSPDQNTLTQDLTLVISPAPLSITPQNVNKVYGAAIPTFSADYVGFVNGDAPGSLSTPPSFSTTATASSPVNTYPITAANAVSANYAISYHPGTLTVTQATLTVTADNKSMPVGGPLPPLTVSYSGFVNGDGVGSLSQAPTATTTATAASPAGGYPIVPGGGQATNYSFNYINGTLTVVAKPVLTITAVAAGSVYGAPLASPLTVTYSGFVNGDGPGNLTTLPTVSNSASAGAAVGNYVLTPGGAQSDTYTFNYVTAPYTITKATLTVTADNKTMPVGGPLPPLTITYTGFVNGDGVSSLSPAPTATTTATTASPAGGYPIVPAGGSATNYSFNYVNGTLTVVAKPVLTITAVAASSVYGAPLASPLTVTYSGFVNGDGPGNLTTLPTVSNTATAGAAVGSYVLTPGGAQSDTYTFNYVTAPYTITKATLTVTADNKTMPVGGPLPALTVTYSGFVNGDGVSSLSPAPTATTTATAASPAGGYPIVPAGGTATNYSFNYVNGTLTVVAKPVLTITAVPASSVYGAPLASPLTVTYSGFVNGDGPGDLTTLPTVSNTATAGAAVGSYVLTPGGAQSNTYTFNYVTAPYTITKAPLTITATSQTMTYGGPVPTLAVTYSGFVNGDGPSSLSTPPSITTTATSASPVAGYPIHVTGAVNNNYSISYVDGTMTVGKARLTVTANNQTMSLGGPLPALTLSYSGFVNGDGVSSLSPAPTATTTATAASPAGTYTITPAGGSATNYSFNYVNGTLTVGKATLTIRANPASSVFGAPLSTNLTVTYTGFVNGDGPGSLTTPPTVANTAFAGANAGSYVLTPGGAQSDNYNIQYVTGVYTISQAPLNITANNQAMTYGGTMPTLTVSYSGFVNGDNPASLTTAPTITTPATSSSPAGNYPITASGAVDPNYAISYTPGTLAIGRASLTVTADSKTMPLGGPLPALTISYTGFVNGDGPGNLTSQPSISVPATAASPAGAYSISVFGAASPNYNFTYVTGILAVGKALLTITANPANSVYGSPLASAGSLTVTYTGFVNGDGPGSLTSQPTVTNTAFTGAPAGNYALIPSGAQSDNYAINYVNGTYTINPAPLTITATSQNMPYGGPVPALTASYSGFVNGDNASRLTTPPTLSTTAAISSPVGTYPITAAGAQSPNYTISYNAGTMTVQRATLTVTPNPITFTYGGTLPGLTLSYSGFVNGDNVSSLTSAPSTNTTASSSSPVGTYPITTTGGSSSNYNFVYNTGTVTINPATIQVTAQAATKAAGGPDPTFNYTVSGLVNGDNSNVFTGSLSRAPGESVGTYPITLGSLSAGGNYTINYTGANFTITIASQQISWSQNLIVGCSDQTQVQLTATASSGLPVTYTVSDPSIASVSGNVLTLLSPGTAIVTATQAGDANHLAATPVEDTIFYQAASLIRQRWSDAIFFDNSSDDYVGWQWYKNGDAVPGATSPYYSEPSALNGQYYVIATNKDSQRVQSCILSISPGAAIPGGIKVFPNPAAAGSSVTVTSNYTSAALQGAVLQVVDLSGRVRQQLTSVQPTMPVTMPSETGTYIVNLLLASGQKSSLNVLVIQ